MKIISRCGLPPANPDAYRCFMRGLAADSRLGRYIAPLVEQSPEVVILHLVRALADAAEGNQSHPALELLERMEANQ